METGYERAIAYATRTRNTKLLRALHDGLENHRSWMREGR